MSKRTACVICWLTLAQFVSAADHSEKQVYSGPQPGERLPPLTVEIAYGERQQTKVDFVKQAGLKPAMLVFVNGANRPAARLTRVLMNYAEMQSRDKLFAATVWLADDRSAGQQYLKQAISWWGNGLPVGISVDGGEGPGAYGLNRNVNVTVLVVDKGKVTANFALVQPGETDAPKILAEVAKLAGGTIPTKAEVVFLSMPTRKPATARWTAAPADQEYRRLICNLLAADDEQSAAAAKAVTVYVGDNAARRVQLQQIAKSLGKGRTNVGAIPAMKYLKRWRAAADNAGRRPRKNAPSKRDRRTTSDNTTRSFDFGTATSPVADSAIQVTDSQHYNADDGYGWLSKQQRGFDRGAPLRELRHGGNPMRPDLLYKAHATRLLQDGIASRHDMQFRIDVPPGTYRVHVWIGDLHQPLESLALDSGGKTVARDISAKHIIGRSKPESTGLYRLIRFNADATDGRVELRFYGDETQYKRDNGRYDQWFSNRVRVDSYLRSPWDPNRRLKFDPNGPFTRNSVLAIRVAPYRPSLIRWKDSKLIPVGKVTNNRDAFVAAFNQGEFSAAETILNAEETAADLRLRGYLALLGHPDVKGEAERRTLSKAQQAVADALKSAQPSVWAIETRDSLDIFSRARHRFLNRGMGDEGHFQENRKVVSMMRIFRPGDLLYYKALEYQGRALQMLDPHRWVYPSGDAKAVWKKLITVFPQNRFARFYLHDEWTPNDIWHHGNHRDGTEGAPEWAVAEREAWGLLLDVCEWWAAHKQHPDGSIGGGWGDDVELVALFGIMAFISEGASEPSLQLARNLIDGLWKYGGIDSSAGFYRGLLDAEHSAEWTGDTLPLMLTIDWENPIWIERATQTARLMRDLWMDYNDRGDLHFRSNFLGSISIGNEKQANDSYINLRAAFPAVSVYRYNRNPVIGRLLVEWADAWLNDAMRIDRNKPLGVFPAEVGFPGGELGGVNSPNWYTAAHPPGTVNYDWQRGQYYGYLVDLMLLAHEITGQEKYLEPFRLQKRLVDQYRDNPDVLPKPGTGLWAGKSLSERTRRGRSSFDLIWQRVEKSRTSSQTDEPAILFDKADVLKRMNAVRREAKRKWPLLTTETSATDRVGFRGIADPFFVMTGTRDMKPSVTYSGVGRNFAAFVKQTDERSLKIVMYNFAAQETKAAVTPWKLDVGGTYRIRTGIDTDNDDEPDQNVAENSFVLNRRGQRVGFVLAPRTTTVLEVRQTKPGRGTAPQADLAVISQEIKYSIWTRDLQVTIHNVGSRSAKKFHVTFYEGTDTGQTEQDRKRIGEVTVPHLSWPLDLAAKSLTVSVPYVPTRSHVPITVVVDERESIEELCESNNRAIRTFEFDLNEIRAPRNRIGEIGGNVTGEIKRGIR